MLVEPGTNCWPIFMQPFDGKILLHALEATSVSQSRRKSTPSELKESRRRSYGPGPRALTVPIVSAPARPSPDWLGTVRRRGSRINDVPGRLSGNAVRLRSKEIQMTLRIDWCLGELRPIPIRVEKTRKRSKLREEDL